jgi:histidyl-tRNA synthetase
MDIKLPKGTHDIIGEEAEGFLAIEQVLKDVVTTYGFHLIRTPIFEHTELFTRSVGDSSDIVRKEMYTFKDKGDRSLTLRPELTAGALRSIVETKMDVTATLPIKLYYNGPAFRYERPQLGRFRQFHQFGVELVGTTQPLQVVETIILGYQSLKHLGFDKVSLKLNSLGDPTTRDNYRDALKTYFEPKLQDLCADCQIRFQTNPLRMLDCKVPADHVIAEHAPKILDFLSPASLRHFNLVTTTLKEEKIDFDLDKTLVRGLDYYSNMVFEFHYQSKQGSSMGALGAGGEYHQLVSDLGGQPLAGVGFAFGLERLYAVMVEEALFENTSISTDIIVMPLSEKEDQEAFRLTQELRASGMIAEINLDHKPLKNQFKFADRRHARFAMIIGEQEVKDQKVTMKNLDTQEQSSISRKEIVHTMIHQLGHDHDHDDDKACDPDCDCND